LRFLEGPALEGVDIPLTLALRFVPFFVLKSAIPAAQPVMPGNLSCRPQCSAFVRNSFALLFSVFGHLFKACERDALSKRKTGG
jgi:hypothetical protein